MKYYYCLTLRRNNPVKSISQIHKVKKTYDYIIAEFKKVNETAYLKYVYEVVPYGKHGYNFHLHGMIESKKPVFLKNTRGVSMRLEICRSKYAWDNYIYKKPLTAEEAVQHLHELLTVRSEDTESEESDIDSQVSIPDARIIPKDI